MYFRYGQSLSHNTHHIVFRKDTCVLCVWRTDDVLRMYVSGVTLKPELWVERGVSFELASHVWFILEIYWGVEWQRPVAMNEWVFTALDPVSALSRGLRELDFVASLFGHLCACSKSKAPRVRVGVLVCMFIAREMFPEGLQKGWSGWC